MKTDRKQLVVLAGGLGNRMVKSGVSLPKLLLRIDQVPLIEIIVKEAVEENFTEILWCLGHGHAEIERYIQSNQTLTAKVKNVVFIEQERKGTLGALIQAQNMIDEDFCLIMGDLLLLRTNLGGVFENFRQRGDDALLLVKYTDHPDDSDLVTVGRNFSVESVNPYPHKFIPRIPIGIAGAVCLKKKHLPEFISGNKSDVFKNLIPEMVLKNLQVRAMFHQGIIRDIGTPDRFKAASISELDIEKLSSSAGIFFDRDGTLNLPNGHISSVQQVQLYPETSRIVALAFRNYDFFGILTNQPVIARGDATMEEVISINSFILSTAGIEDESKVVVKICPHYPEMGFIGEIADLKKVCICRKPASGMLLDTINENLLRSNKTIYVGDSIADLEAAQGAGIYWIHLLNQHSLSCNDHLDLTIGSCMSRAELLVFLEELKGV